MKTAIIYGPRDLRIDDVEVPKLGPGDVIIQVKACGICGSDVHRYVGDRFGLRLAPYPLNSGHEYCGIATRVGEKVKRVHVGDRVTLGLNWVRDGNGAFSEYIRIPEADKRPISKVPREISFEEASIIEPLNVALNGFAGVRPRAGERVLILGAGPIGLCLVQRCRAAGIRDIIVSEVSPKRLEVAKKLGAVTVDATKESLEERVEDLARGEGVDVTFECAGASVTTRQALSLTRRRGKIMLIAHYGKSGEIDAEEIVSNGFMVRGYGEYLKDPSGEAISLILEEKVKLQPLISHRFPLEMAKEAFEVASRPAESVKVIVEP